MKIATLTGHSYAITAFRPCTVSSVAGDGSLIPLLSITVPGQYVLVAPSTMLDINEDHTLVTPMKGRTGITGGLLQASLGMLQSHFEDNYIHVNRGDRNKWDDTISSQNFADHKYNMDLHLSSNEHASLKQLLANKDALLALLNPDRTQTA